MQAKRSAMEAHRITAKRSAMEAHKVMTRGANGGYDEENKLYKKRGGDDDDDDDDIMEEVRATSPGGDCGAVGKSEDSDRWICRGRNLAWIREHRTSRS